MDSPIAFTIIYAELERDLRIVERGVFYSVSEFAPYYAAGWRGAAHWNAAAERYNADHPDYCDNEYRIAP